MEHRETKDDKCLPSDGLSPLPLNLLVPSFHKMTTGTHHCFLALNLPRQPLGTSARGSPRNSQALLPKDSLTRTSSRLWKPPLSLDQQTKSIPHFFYSVFKQILCVVNRYLPADSDYSHEVKRCLLLGRKTMTNLDSVLKSRDITLPTKVCIVKVMVFQLSCMDVRVGP